MILGIVLLSVAACQDGPDPTRSLSLPTEGPVLPLPSEGHVQSASDDGPLGSPVGEPLVFASSSIDVPADFPLVSYWDAVRRGEEFANAAVSREEVIAWWSARENALASCMKKKGFLFFPRAAHDPTQDKMDSVSLDRDYLRIPKLPLTRAEAAAVGYGVEPKAVEEPLVLENENDQYVAGLSLKERSAYYVALEGADITAPDYDPYNRSDDGEGCARRIERDYPDPGDKKLAENILEQHGDIVSEMTRFTRSGEMFKHERIIELNLAWRSCMAAKGFAPDSPSREGSLWDGPVQAYMRAVRTDPSGRAGEVGVDPSALPDNQQRLVGSEAEREIALLDFDCRAETDYLRVFSATQREAEEEFVKANRKALDAMRAFVDELG